MRRDIRTAPARKAAGGTMVRKDFRAAWLAAFLAILLIVAAVVWALIA